MDMKKATLALGLSALALAAGAQEQGRVLSATPIVQQFAIPQQICSNETVYTDPRPSGAGAVIGAIAGGAAGNAIGKGSGRAAATAIGVLGGAVLGHQIEGQGHAQPQTIQRCTTETYYENRTIGYDVVYEYAGRQYSTRTANNPGAWIPVIVQPATPGIYSTQPLAGGQPHPYMQPGTISTYPLAPSYSPPGVTIIEYPNDGRRPPLPAPRNPYVR